MTIDFAFKLDEPNYNNRIYSTDVFEKAIKKALENHPGGIFIVKDQEDPLSYSKSDISAQDIYGVVTGYTMADHLVTCEATITNPQIATLIASGADIKIGPNSRGMLKETERGYEVDEMTLLNFSLLMFDKDWKYL